jgi:hypothetical protein
MMGVEYKKNGCTKIGEIKDMNSTFNQLLSMKNLRDVQKNRNFGSN